MTRILFVVALLCAFAAPVVNGQSMTKQLIASGLSRPVLAISPDGDMERLFIVEQGNSSSRIARIRIVKNGSMLATPFLNIDSLVINSGNERGLLGLAFHPNYMQNGYFFVNYNNTSGQTVIRRYQANPPTADTVSLGTGFTLMTISQPYSNHNGGMIAFGPDGYLYIGMGDGGSGNDPGNRAQNLNSLLGKMLRIDVDNPNPGLAYGIPASNPLVGITGRDEIWHWGLRNPWRWSFDRQNGDMWIGDVGQNAREEISYAPAGLGGRNFGWRCMEGNGCTGLSGCTCNSNALADPVHTYFQGSSTGWCVTGGYVYRGCSMPWLQGQYFFGDYLTSKIWTGTLNSSGTALTGIQDRSSQLSSGISGLGSFGQDGLGELYLIARDGGVVYKITSAFGMTQTRSGTPSIGNTVNYNLFSYGQGGLPYIFGLSSNGTYPGMPLPDGRTIPINDDPMLQFALMNPTNTIYSPYGNLAGFLANASVPVNIPNLPFLVGQEFWSAFLTLNTSAPSGVQSISCAIQTTVQ